MDPLRVAQFIRTYSKHINQFPGTLKRRNGANETILNPENGSSKFLLVSWKFSNQTRPPTTRNK